MKGVIDITSDSPQAVYDIYKTKHHGESEVDIEKTELQVAEPSTPKLAMHIA